MRKNNLAENRIGTIGKNNYGSLMEVVAYNNVHDIWVKFDKGKPVHTEWKNFIKGSVRNVYDRTVYGVGYLGENNKNGVTKQTEQYIVWSSMIQRCYNEHRRNKYPSYKGCIVTEEWHNFQNFITWYDQNYYEVNDEVMQLDKDILSKGNKVYSPDLCIFVPKRINNLFLKCDSSRGDLPIGVTFHNINNNYMAQCRNGTGKLIHMGSYDSVEVAFLAYKHFKEKLIKEVAEEYKDKIPVKLYNAMLKYQVEITD